jgi:mannose-6-phosphate isomerase-like protein (cupin superfamily)
MTRSPSHDDHENPALRSLVPTGTYSRRAKAGILGKYGVRMHIHSMKDDCHLAAVVCEETDVGHLEEFFHENSAFIYYIIEGEGVFVIEGYECPVRATDVVIVPPKKRFRFRAAPETGLRNGSGVEG